VSNSIVAYYQAHVAAVATHTGGESADWRDIANALAQTYLDRLGELPFERPLRYAWAYPIRRPNGQWPNLVIRQVASVPVDIDSVWTEWTHQAVVLLIGGPANSDPARMEELWGEYQWPMKAVLDQNQSLDGRVASIRVAPEGFRWGVTPYGDPPNNRWYALGLTVLLYGHTRRIRQL
jgi:hypothetical protein